MELPNEWLEFLSLLQRHDAKFVIVGAYAMAVHGRPRASQDIDILIEPSAENSERVAQALDEFGYPELAKESVEAFTKTPRMASLGVPPLRIDIMNYIDGMHLESDTETASNVAMPSCASATTPLVISIAPPGLRAGTHQAEVQQDSHHDQHEMHPVDRAVAVDGECVGERRERHEEEAQQRPEGRFVGSPDVIAE